MLSMRALLSVSPFLPIETQRAVRVRSGEARRALVYLGVNECEARELLDEKVDCSAKLQARSHASF